MGQTHREDLKQLEGHAEQLTGNLQERPRRIRPQRSRRAFVVTVSQVAADRSHPDRVIIACHDKASLSEKGGPPSLLCHFCFIPKPMRAAP